MIVCHRPIRVYQCSIQKGSDEQTPLSKAEKQKLYRARVKEESTKTAEQFKQACAGHLDAISEYSSTIKTLELNLNTQQCNFDEQLVDLRGQLANLREELASSRGENRLLAKEVKRIQGELARKNNELLRALRASHDAPMDVMRQKQEVLELLQQLQTQKAEIATERKLLREDSLVFEPIESESRSEESDFYAESSNGSIDTAPCCGFSLRCSDGSISFSSVPACTVKTPGSLGGADICC